MTTENQPTGASESLDHLLNAFAELPEPGTEELREAVKAMGIDPDEAVSRIRKLMAAKADDARLAWRAEARKKLANLRERLRSISLDIPPTREVLLERLRTAMAEGSGGETRAQLQFAFHRLEELGTEDLLSLVEEIELLKQLEANQEPGHEP